MKAGALAAALLLSLAAPVQAERLAVLESSSEGTCWHPHFTDNMVSTETVEITLPEIEGPVSAQGRYAMTGTMPGGPYSMSGVSALGGTVRDDAELVITHEQWNYMGEWMPSDFPSEAEPVIVPLEPGATVTVNRDTTYDGVRCVSKVVYRLEFERATQVWDIALRGERTLLDRTTYDLIDPQSGARRPFRYEHGFTFDYRLSARATLVKRKGVWEFDAATVTAASATARYDQTPELFRVIAQTCPGCIRVAGLAGQALGGDSDGTTLRLAWPAALSPVARIEAVPNFRCPPDPQDSTCENKRRMGTGYAAQDDDFLGRAASHRLVLKAGPQPVVAKPSDTMTSFKSIRHDYTLTRVK